MLTAQGMIDVLTRVDRHKQYPTIPVSGMPRSAFDAICNRYGIDKDAAIAEGKRFQTDAVIMGYGIIFTKPIPQSGVVWKGSV